MTFNRAVEQTTTTEQNGMTNRPFKRWQTNEPTIIDNNFALVLPPNYVRYLMIDFSNTFDTVNDIVLVKSSTCWVYLLIFLIGSCLS